MKKYGIVGYPLAHSFSQKYFTQKFADEKIRDAVFETYEMSDIKGIEPLLNDKNLQGFCITIPHKKNMLPYLFERTSAVKETGACNCVRIRDGKLFGYNTDVIGFEKSFTAHLQPHHKRALVLGTGGAAAAVTYVLRKLGIDYRCVSTSKKPETLAYSELDKNILDAHSIIINCTPLGTYPKTDVAPAIPYQFITSKHYLFDLVYNPPLTKFLALGKEKGAFVQNGYDMLIFQAEENWKIWNE